MPLWPLRLLCASSTHRRQHLLIPSSHLGFNLLISQEKLLGTSTPIGTTAQGHGSSWLPVAMPLAHHVLPCSVGPSHDLLLLLVPGNRTSNPPGNRSSALHGTCPWHWPAFPLLPAAQQHPVQTQPAGPQQDPYPTPLTPIYKLAHLPAEALMVALEGLVIFCGVSSRDRDPSNAVPVASVVFPQSSSLPGFLRLPWAWAAHPGGAKQGRKSLFVLSVIKASRAWAVCVY